MKGNKSQNKANNAEEHAWPKREIGDGTDTMWQSFE